MQGRAFRQIGGAVGLAVDVHQRPRAHHARLEAGLRKSALEAYSLGARRVVPVVSPAGRHDAGLWQVAGPVPADCRRTEKGLPDASRIAGPGRSQILPKRCRAPSRRLHRRAKRSLGDEASPAQGVRVKPAPRPKARQHRAPATSALVARKAARKCCLFSSSPFPFGTLERRDAAGNGYFVGRRTSVDADSGGRPDICWGENRRWAGLVPAF